MTIKKELAGDRLKAKQSVNELQEAASDAYQHEKNQFMEDLEKTKQKAEDIYKNAKDLAVNMYEEGKKKLSEVGTEQCMKDLSAKVKENPLSSLLIAAGIGFLASALLKK